MKGRKELFVRRLGFGIITQGNAELSRLKPPWTHIVTLGFENPPLSGWRDREVDRGILRLVSLPLYLNSYDLERNQFPVESPVGSVPFPHYLYRDKYASKE